VKLSRKRNEDEEATEKVSFIGILIGNHVAQNGPALSALVVYWCGGLEMQIL
jgi:hypothetical protein